MARDITTLPYFDGFPYLTVRLSPAVYRIILLPADWTQDAMWGAALRQARVNGLPVCLAAGPDRGEYYDPETDRAQIAGIPRAGIHPPGRLAPVEPIPEVGEDEAERAGAAAQRAGAADLAARARALRAYRAERNGSGPVVVAGDPKKGGRPATAEDLVRLGASRPGGAPAGLERCPTCGEWKGECLDTMPRSQSFVVRVHCMCENRNRCAACGGLLADRKLNGNEYDEATGRVVHLGGVAALGHTC